MRRCGLVSVLLAAWLAAVGQAQEDRQREDEAAIRKAVEAYVACFNQGDAQALAALWSPEAVYINPISGEQVVGRAAIQQQFTSIFADATGIRLEATTQAIQFISPNVAIEQGSAKVTRSEQTAEESEYTAVYVKRDGQWLLDRVTEEDVPVITSHYEQLKDLEWMIGVWVDQDEESQIVTSCQWTKNRNFLTRFFTVTVRDQLDMSGLQIIGWDPAAKQIRSWVFDSGGGFGEGRWTKKESRWFIQSTGTLPDGKKSSAVHIITYLDQDRFTWQSVNREAGGEILPNVDEVMVVRQTDTE